MAAGRRPSAIASMIASGSPAVRARRRWAQNSNCALQKRPAIRIAISLSAGGMLLWKRTYSPTSWIRSAASGAAQQGVERAARPLARARDDLLVALALARRHGGVGEQGEA